MSTLHQRLDALADLAVPGAAIDPGEPAAAWQRGLRFRRRRRVGTAAIIVVTLALLAGLGEAALVRRDPAITPAGSNTTAGLPNRLYKPSPWLAGTADEGPLGQLAVLIPAERKGWGAGSTDAVVGVSASTGEYRFLDLPDRAEGGELSPDGRQVAYWLTGRPTGSPNTTGGQSLVVTGVAIYDTVSGDVRSAPVETEHGLGVDGLVWADDDTLLAGYGQELGGDDDPESSVSNGHRWYAWSAQDTSPRTIDALSEGDSVDVAGNGFALVSTGRTYDVLVDLADGSRTKVFEDSMRSTNTAIDATGRRLATPGRKGPNAASRIPAKLRVRNVDGSTFIVPDSENTYAALAWVDETRVAVQTAPPPGDSESLRIDLVDIRDGTRQILVRLNAVGSYDAQLTTDLLSQPTLEAIEPPRPLDPRWVAGGLTSIALLGGIGLLRWRRRVTP